MPTKKTIERKTISEAQLKLELIKLFDSGQTGKSNSYDQLRTKYKLEKQRCLKLYDIAHEEWANLKDKATNEQIQANAKESLKQGLKSKIERVLYYQNEIERCVKQLNGDLPFTYIVLSKIYNSHTNGKYSVPIQIQNDLRQQIKSFQTEISKIEGDYAATKNELTGKDGERLNSFDITLKI